MALSGRGTPQRIDVAQVLIERDRKVVVVHTLNEARRDALSSSSVPNVGIVVILIAIVLALLLAGALVGLVFELLWLVITGLAIGALGRLVLPGQQLIGLLATALVGIAASLLGGILADIFDAGWLVQFLVAVALAAIGITIFASSERERSSSAI
jgi:uncharacterized membrane protein YeaQ/YmgE (transglycosylase-associated protein family)